ncbi:methyltransferase family protein [Tautonia marina]|uniref:methyltransferase family protein n=1 Tax=Tautonia marina TaxID=2653855 RepID=UPI00191C2B07|nr:isoprenylcysteine carboxylmethyltransferase family protein [Tautonia marina]
MTLADDQDRRPQGFNTRRLVVGLMAVPVLFGLLMFLPAGTWAWRKGWLFVLVVLTSWVAVFLTLWRVNPEVLIARSRPQEGAKRWDRILVGYFLFPAIGAILPVAALDDARFHWSPVPWWVCGIGYLLFLSGMALTTWAEAVNMFFEVHVRIQRDRGHVVIDSGPYALVRHPGYVGGCLFTAGMALALGSLWALIPAGVASLLLVLRTQWEDQALQAELPGYDAYTRRVRYKLIPGVW